MLQGPKNLPPNAVDQARIQRVVRLARLMDTALRIPGTNVRLGADAVLGLIPGVGDIAGSLIGLFIVNEARRLGLPVHKLAAMLTNLALDTASGLFPVIGDAFDIFFRSHRRNASIILDHFRVEVPDISLREHRGERGRRRQ